jgi:1-pyrroline-5-carboxylate dehydrogenase
MHYEIHYLSQIYVYEDNDWSKVLKLVDESSDYALTGSMFDPHIPVSNNSFATDRSAIVEATNALRYSAGEYLELR